MRYGHELWDWPPTRQRPKYYRSPKYFDVYQPSGWSSPIVRKIVNVYWAVTVFLIKALIAIPLSIMLIGSIWLLAVIVSLVV